MGSATGETTGASSDNEPSTDDELDRKVNFCWLWPMPWEMVGLIVIPGAALLVAVIALVTTWLQGGDTSSEDIRASVDVQRTSDVSSSGDAAGNLLPAVDLEIVTDATATIGHRVPIVVTAHNAGSTSIREPVLSTTVSGGEDKQGECDGSLGEELDGESTVHRACTFVRKEPGPVTIMSTLEGTNLTKVPSNELLITFVEPKCPDPAGLGDDPLPITSAAFRQAWNAFMKDGWAGDCDGEGFVDPAAWELTDDAGPLGTGGSNFEIRASDRKIDEVIVFVSDADLDEVPHVKSMLEALLHLDPDSWDDGCDEAQQGFDGTAIALGDLGHEMTAKLC